ncbi:chalcone isomerase family protein [Pseudoalteromonas luteoviolacea]|uniref:Chalcone isomerase domain-containing protein n=1 Tax=Pseudoalteromonas luteoviolacea S4060-1 TaxID=1365257 RepID=A0A167P6V8_9GAMM|nr:chalcone isomerase family protein [Pseudoalteromonas luteoviolacea]KZN69620.1 hypothetical protein N478_10750 [Pseudoalteromonas luteoviolacea S4060-1]
MTQVKLSMAAIVVLFSSIAHSAAFDPKEVKKGMTQVGQTARMTYLFWDVYDISLYTPSGQYEPSAPFVLQLTYLRDLSGEDIAERSLEEMEKQGFEDEQMGRVWLERMKNIFPDVENNYSLYGLRTPSGTTQFYNAEKLLGEIEDPLFTKWFFDIWLGNKTSEPKMRLKLLGGKS